MHDGTYASDEFHLRVAVERLVRDGHSQREIEATVLRMLGGKPTGPRLTTRLRRFVRV